VGIATGGWRHRGFEGRPIYNIDNLLGLCSLVKTKSVIYAIYMGAKGKVGINLNLNEELLARIEKYRHRRMFATRTEAIEFLLEAGLKANPENPKKKGE